MQKVRKKVGRPTKYRPEYCEKILEFFSQAPFQEIKCPDTGNIKRFGNPMPFLSTFAKEIGVNQDTLHEWSRVHPEFSEALKKAKSLQKEFLITNGLLGLYNPTFAIFTAKNITDMRNEGSPPENKNDYLLGKKAEDLTTEELLAYFDQRH